jgi:formylmethanofuran dehydrogenase subunit E
MDREDRIDPVLDEVAAFHGHVCPGLLIGYRAALLAMESLGVEPSADEDLVLIAENDSCSVDAFQYLLSTTFGKGNLMFEDNGKQVFTVGDRKRDRAVRIALRSDAFGPARDEAHAMSRDERMSLLLSAPATDLFHVQSVQISLPPRADIRKSVPCSRCHEEAMETRIVREGERSFCLPCARDLGLDLSAFGRTVTSGRMGTLAG